MKRKIVIALMVLLVIGGSLFATRIRVTYNGTDYVLLTTRTITDADVAYFNGMYDALASVMEGRQLYQIYDTIQGKNYESMLVEGANTDVAVARADYEAAFIDCMTSYSYGSDGEFKDLWPIYKQLMSSGMSYSNAERIVEFGSARFYPSNIV